jgi:CDP-glucose 4,6-dehydratase
MLGSRLWAQGHEFAEAWNFGPREEDSVSVLELAERVIGYWGAGQLTIRQRADDPHESQHLKLESSKARVRLHWWPVLTLAEALNWSVRWYQAFLNGAESAAEMTARQIADYRSRVIG